jgi:hypothetical protein
MTAQGGRQTKEATMTTSTYLIRITRLLVLCAVVVGTVASVAGASDVLSYGERWQGVDQASKSVEAAGNVPTPQGLKADGLRLQGIAKVYQQLQAVPDVVERYVSVHANGVGFSSNAASVSRPSDTSDAALALHQAVPDVVERYVSVHANGAGFSSNAASVQHGSVTQSSTGFDWGDWAIGLVVGFGLALVVAGGVLLASRRFSRIGRTGAAAAG